MDEKLYQVTISFEGLTEGALVRLEPTDRIEYLASHGYLRVIGPDRDEEVLPAPSEEELAQRIETANRRRTRKG